MKLWLKRPASVAVLSLVVIGYALLLWKGPWLIDGDHLRKTDLQPADGVVITGVRTALVALGAGVIAALGLYYTRQTLQQTRKRDDEHAKATTEGQINERYVDAVKLLAAEDSLTQRLGGIYALERNMHDSDRDHPTVVAILGAFLRSSAPLGEAPDSSENKQVSKALAPDIQAVLEVLGRRPGRDPVVPLDLSRTRLSGASLCGMDLRGSSFGLANLSGVNLANADLTKAKLDGADLRGASLATTRLVNSYLSDVDLREASLSHARLNGATLSRAKLDGADCTMAKITQAVLVGASFKGANLMRADLRESDLTGATLTGANLVGADLRGVTVTPEQLATAWITPSTLLSLPLADNPKVIERIRECEARFSF